jgi:hypothetical protein
MTSSNLNPSSYSKAAENFSCPAPATPPSVTISSGLTTIDLRTLTCKSVTWGATASGGSGVYTAFTWTIDGSVSSNGSSSSFTTTICRGWGGGFTLGVTVKDSNNLTGSASRWVSVLEPTCTNACLCAITSSDPSKAVPICQ